VERVPFDRLTPCPDSDRWLLDGVPFTGVALSADGPFRGEREYRDGLEDGWSRVWWVPTGTLNHEQHWADGWADGPCRNWYPDGTPRSDETFAAGELVRGRYWDPSGALVEEVDGRPTAPAGGDGAA
jgi:antitoxin component YwqK of YwqJK toxin-antitoxin module